MKKPDMRKAMEEGTPVAISLFRGQDYPTFASKAIIVRLNAERTVSGGRSYRLKKAQDGVIVRYLPAPSEREDEVVIARNVIDTWEEYEHRTAEIAQRRKESEQSRASVEERAQSLARRLTELGFPAETDYYLPRSHRAGPGYYRGVRLGFTAAEKLVELLETEAVGSPGY